MAVWGNAERDGTLVNTHKFTGKELDAPTGLYYYGARYYDCSVGRFITPDLEPEVPGDRILSKPQRLNPYVYCINNPLVRLDLDGLTDILIQIQRTMETNLSTIGKFAVSGTDIKGVTLELPWRNNQKYISSIPAGTYVATKEYSDKFKTEVLRLQNVPGGREGILMHPGNRPKDTQGCILPGTTTAGKDRISGSGEALDRTTQYVETVQQQDQQKGEKTNIQVEIKDPPQQQGPPKPVEKVESLGSD